jgi:hypothetical protein
MRRRQIYPNAARITERAKSNSADRSRACRVVFGSTIARREQGMDLSPGRKLDVGRKRQEDEWPTSFLADRIGKQW